MLNVAYAILAENRSTDELNDLDAMLEDDTPIPSRAEQIGAFMVAADGGRL